MKARTENLSEHISTLALDGDAELSTSQRVDKFFKFVEVSVDAAGVGSRVTDSSCELSFLSLHCVYV